MKKIAFLARCIGCGDQHLEVNCRKPTALAPVITKSFCDHCESALVLSISKVRGEKRQVNVGTVKINPSAKLLAQIAERMAKKEAETQSEFESKETPNEL